MMLAEVWAFGDDAGALERDALDKAAPFFQAHKDRGVWYGPVTYSWKLVIVKASAASRHDVITNGDGTEVSAGTWTAMVTVGLEKVS